MDSAIVSVMGVLASALISTLVARQTASLQLKIQTDQQFNTLLFQNRLSSYRILYEHLSKFIKIIAFGKLSNSGEIDNSISKEDVVQFLLGLEAWDSQNAIFLTTYSSDVCADLITQLNELIRKGSEEIEHEFNSSEKRKTWLHTIGKLEASIKNEIGVYAISPFPTNPNFKPIFTYQEVQKLIVDSEEKKP
jgi:hypothetical protein